MGELRNANVTPLSETKVAERLGISKQAITRAVMTALKQGWLVNHETKRGYPFDLDVGELLPEALGLPDPESLREEQGGPQEDERAEALELQVPGKESDAGERQAVQSLTGGRW